MDLLCILGVAKRYERSKEPYEKAADIRPGKSSVPGHRAGDNHQFINAVLWVLRSGAHWHDLPERYGIYIH